MARPALDTPVAALAAQLRGADLLLHAAANTNVEQCEREPDACYRDNFLLSELLARAAAQARCRCCWSPARGCTAQPAARRTANTPPPCRPRTTTAASCWPNKPCWRRAAQPGGAHRLAVRRGGQLAQEFRSAPHRRSAQGRRRR
jgi:hypothetical protein